jgi:hypothetical protein
MRCAVRRVVIRVVHRFTCPVGKRLRLPFRNGPLFQVGRILGSAARLDARPDSTHVPARWRTVRLRPITMIRLVRTAPELAHAARIAGCHLRRSHSGSASDPAQKRPGEAYPS